MLRQVGLRPTRQRMSLGWILFGKGDRHLTAEFENWRRIRDWEGAEGWVYHSLLSGKRTAVVVPKLNAELVPLYESADASSAVTARLQSGVLGSLKSCDGMWCRFFGKNFSGYIRQDRLWGAYPNEKVD